MSADGTGNSESAPTSPHGRQQHRTPHQRRPGRRNPSPGLDASTRPPTNGSAWQRYRPSKAVMMLRIWSGSSLQVASPTDSSTRCTPGIRRGHRLRPDPDPLLNGQLAGGGGKAALRRLQQQVHHRNLRRVGHDPHPHGIAERSRDLARAWLRYSDISLPPAPHAAQGRRGVGPQTKQGAAHALPPLPHLGDDVRGARHAAAGSAPMPL